jgi:hypothetical protein
LKQDRFIEATGQDFDKSEVMAGDGGRGRAKHDASASPCTGTELFDDTQYIL